MPITETAVRKRAEQALRKALKAVRSKVVIDKRGRVASNTDHLVSSVMTADFEADLKQGSGNETNDKFRAVHSSSALAVNCFGPFKRNLSDLQVCDFDGFTSLQFEKKCPTGLPGTPPHLDVIIERPDQIVAIESKCTEYFSRTTPKFKDSYKTSINDACRESVWFQEMKRLIQPPQVPSRLKADQLIKHAFGLITCYPHRPVTLLYLYWEPLNAVEYSLFGEHRDEIAAFAERIPGSDLIFESMTYNELWSSWGETVSEWLDKHREDLRDRYAMRI